MRKSHIENHIVTLLAHISTHNVGNVTLAGTPLTWATSIKYLGIDLMVGS